MKKVSHKKLLRRTLYVCSGTLLLLNSGVGVASVFVINQNRAQASQVNPRAGLADISILQNASLTSTTGTQMTPNAQGNFDLSLNYTGQGVATVGVADKKVLVYALPASLQGKVVGGSTVDIQADLLPITPGDVPGVKTLFDALGLTITALDKALKIPAVVAAFNDLKKVQDLGSYQETVTANVSPDGKTISVDFTQGFGRYVHQAYAALFNTLRDAIAAVHSDNILIETLVKALQKASADLFAIIDAIAGGTSTILDSALSGNLLGSASGTLHTTVSDPGVPTDTVKAAAINNALISADILTAVEQEGEAVTLNFPTTATNPIENYDVATPMVTQPVAGQTTVAGNVILKEPIPDVTSFEATVTLADGTQKTAAVDENGNFNVPIDAVKAGDKLTVEIIAHNGDHEKGSDKVNVTVEAGNPGETNPLENYVVAKPSVDPVKAGDTKVTGKVTINKPFPEGTTFEASVTMPDGSVKYGMVDINGNFIVKTGQLKAGQRLIVTIIAHNGDFEKDGQPVTVRVADNNQDGSGNGNGGTGNGGNTNGNSNGSHNPGNNNAGNGGQTNNGGNGQLGNSNNVNNLTNNGSNSGQNNHHMLNVGVSDTTGSQNANSKAGDLPQTDANKTGVWAAVGAFLIAMVALFKSLLPIKRDK
ncbi:adhesive domain-containing protein [Latilactobacillus sakei]|uniref:adhesive domain-containing protein n=1 Tax=Latilactobacillus sakei TaxID=1599 RepID=UPI0009776FB7|nr:adhesive domain-containing protein [Latilactobacillus sakei]